MANKKLKQIIIRTFLGLFAFAFIAIAILTAPAWKKRWFTYPSLEKASITLQQQYHKPSSIIPLQDYKGVLHSHSYWSHDSRGILEEILPAAKQAKLDFIFLSDHKHANLDTFPRGFHGVYEDILIEAGTESHGMMVTPMDSTILNWDKGKDSIIKEVVDHGGMAFYVHSEEPHDWGNPDYHGMEIYNIHTDLIDETGIFPFLINSMINGPKYRHWAYRELYDEQTAIWNLWDSLNQHRKIIGISAVDAHNNQNFRARYLADGKVEWVGPNAKTIEIVEPGLRERLLLGEPDTAGWVFNWGIDTYFHSFNYVNTHILADTFSNTALRDALLAGHAYIAFESLGEATGFQFYATNEKDSLVGMMGDSISISEVSSLKAISPLPVQFRLVKDGEEVDEQNNTYEYTYATISEKGNYRLEAFLMLDGAWTRWVMTQPIYVY